MYFFFYFLFYTHTTKTHTHTLKQHRKIVKNIFKQTINNDNYNYNQQQKKSPNCERWEMRKCTEKIYFY